MANNAQRGNKEVEYREIGTNMRFVQIFRFVQLFFLFFLFCFLKERVVGFLISGLLFLMDLSVTRFSYFYRDQAVELEKQLGYQLQTIAQGLNRPFSHPAGKPSRIGGVCRALFIAATSQTLATWFIYLVAMVSWLSR